MATTLPSSTACCQSCETTTSVEVPGPAGADGADGINAFTTVAALSGWTMPAELGTVNLTVGDSSWAIVGQIVYIASAGYFEVTAKSDSTHLTVKNLEDAATGAYASNAAPGTVFAGGGAISPGGLQGALTTGSDWDDSQLLVFGTEYLSKFHLTIRGAGTPIIRMTGDSTTVGSNLPAPEGQGYIWQTLQLLLANHIPKFTVNYNVDGAGKTINWWRNDALGLTADLAATPNLLIIRWGLNPYDPGGGADLAVTFRTELRAALTHIRTTSAKPVEDLSIVLMTPSPADNAGASPARDLAYILSLNGAVREAARDFQCCFIDTTRLWIDACADDNWMLPLGSEVPPSAPAGEHVHPYSVFTETIASKIFETILPESIRKIYGSSRFLNPARTADAYTQREYTDAPSAFGQGISLFEAPVADGWPYEGGSLTFQQGGGRPIQLNYDYDATYPRFRSRTKKASGAWSAWMESGIVNDLRATTGARTLAELPSAFPDGMQMYSVLLADSWPGQVAAGTLVVQKFANAFVVQTLVTDVGYTYTRTSVGVGAWTAWSFVTNRYSLTSGSVVPGACGDATATVTSFVGDKKRGIIQIQAAGTPAAGPGIIFTHNIVSAYPAVIRPVVTPYNDATALLNVFAQGASTSAWNLYAATGTTLVAGTTYAWTYDLDCTI